MARPRSIDPQLVQKALEASRQTQDCQELRQALAVLLQPKPAPLWIKRPEFPAWVAPPWCACSMLLRTGKFLRRAKFGVDGGVP